MGLWERHLGGANGRRGQLAGASDRAIHWRRRGEACVSVVVAEAAARHQSPRGGGGGDAPPESERI